MTNQRTRPIWCLPDTRRPPPPLPPSYRSMLYPAYADKLSRNIPAEEQMKDISISRKSGEHAMYLYAKRIYYSETLNKEYIERIHQMSYSSLSDNGMLQIFSFLIK